jgi:hypothetical protein
MTFHTTLLGALGPLGRVGPVSRAQSRANGSRYKTLRAALCFATLAQTPPLRVPAGDRGSALVERYSGLEPSVHCSQQRRFAMMSRAVIASVVSLGALSAATGVAQAAPAPGAAPKPAVAAQSLIAPVHYRCVVRRCGPYRCVWINRCRRPWWW